MAAGDRLEPFSNYYGMGREISSEKYVVSKLEVFGL